MIDAYTTHPFRTELVWKSHSIVSCSLRWLSWPYALQSKVLRITVVTEPRTSWKNWSDIANVLYPAFGSCLIRCKYA